MNASMLEVLLFGTLKADCVRRSPPEINTNPKNENPPSLKLWRVKAEREGFEPPDLLQSTVFKTAAFDRSAISPAQKYVCRLNRQNLSNNIFNCLLNIYRNDNQYISYIQLRVVK